MTFTQKLGKSILCEIRPINLLSFGPETISLKLRNLNVFIGPNGAGKSNLIEALALMRATPVLPQATGTTDVRSVIRRGGGIKEWIWKGGREKPATIELIHNNPGGSQNLRHKFSFRADSSGFKLDDEKVENEKPYGAEPKAYFFYHFENGNPVINSANEKRRKLARETVQQDVSILAQRRDPEQYPEITYLAETYEKWRIYREWAFGRNTVFREPQKADMRNDRLEEDFSNLGLILSRVRKDPKAKKAVVEGLRDLY